MQELRKSIEIIWRPVPGFYVASLGELQNHRNGHEGVIHVVEEFTDAPKPTLYCPVCGANDEVSIKVEQTSFKEFRTGCSDCGHGFRAGDIGLSVAAWNRQDVFDELIKLKRQINTLEKELQDAQNSAKNR